MGYETRVFIVDTYGNDKGYYTILASIEMGKIIYGDYFNDLLNKIRLENEKKLNVRIKDRLDKYYSLRFEVMDKGFSDKKTMDKIKELSNYLSEDLPFIYLDGNTKEFEDDYGDLLLICDIDRLLEALECDRAKDLLQYKERRWHRYDIAITMLSLFKQYEGENIKAILWGH